MGDPADPADAAPLGTGSVLADRYELKRLLGRGGMGVVYEAHDRLLGETVAIKLLRADVGSASMSQRFMSEIKLARSVSHRNVCRIHEYGEAGGLQYISMAFVPGRELRELVRETSGLAPHLAYEFSLQIADGLQAIHDEGIVHRDLKSANVMVDGRGIARLMDFGIAKQWQGMGSAGITGTGQIIGTPDYMSPEQIRGVKDIDGRSDVYALGVLVYELFTGSTPFHGDDPVTVLFQHLKTPPPLDHPALGPGLRAVLARALAKNPDERYPSATAFRTALAEARSRGETDVPALPDTLPGSSPPDRPRVVSQATEDLPAPVALPREAFATPAPVAAPRVPPTAILPTPREPAGRPAWPLVAGAAVVVLVAALVVMRSRPDEVAPTPPVTVPLAAPPVTDAVPPTTLATAPVEEAMTVVPTPAATPRATAVVEPPPTTLAAPPASAPARPAVPDHTAEVERLVRSAEAAMDAQDYDGAIALYDKALVLAPADPVARLGRATAVNARVTSRAATAAAPVGKPFKAGTSRSTSGQKGKEPAFGDVFEADPSMEVTRDTGDELRPGRIDFRVVPPTVRPGDPYTIEIRFQNSGRAPIAIREMAVTSVVNGKAQAGPVPPRVREVGPGKQEVLLPLSDRLPDAIETWELRVLVKTATGDSYENELRWTR